jgi:hypothetical protein
MRSKKSIIEDALKGSSVLSIVENALKRNHHVKLVEKTEENYLSTGHDEYGRAQAYYFKVAPRPPLYTAEEMQKFMINLIPHPYSSMGPFCERAGGDMEFGHLVFDDVIGSVKTTGVIKLTAQDLIMNPKLAELEFLNGKKMINEEEEIIRKIYVNPYPSILVAKNASKFPYSISSFELRMIREGKIRNLL